MHIYHLAKKVHISLYSIMITKQREHGHIPKRVCSLHWFKMFYLNIHNNMAVDVWRHNDKKAYAHYTNSQSSLGSRTHTLTIQFYSIPMPNVFSHNYCHAKATLSYIIGFCQFILKFVAASLKNAVNYKSMYKIMSWALYKVSWCTKVVRKC